MGKMLTKNQWNERMIFNPYEITAAGGKPLIWIEFSSHNGAWLVHGVGFITDPDAHWTLNGSKAFYGRGKAEKERELLIAKDWCKVAYGVCAWEKSSFGSWHPLGTLAKAAEKKAK